MISTSEPRGENLADGSAKVRDLVSPATATALSSATRSSMQCPAAGSIAGQAADRGPARNRKLACRVALGRPRRWTGRHHAPRGTTDQLAASALLGDELADGSRPISRPWRPGAMCINRLDLRRLVVRPAGAPPGSSTPTLSWSCCATTTRRTSTTGRASGGDEQHRPQRAAARRERIEIAGMVIWVGFPIRAWQDLRRDRTTSTPQ